MPSPDLDQGGSSRQWIRVYLGPSLGWVDMIDANVLRVITGGVTNVTAGTTLVTIDSNSSPTIQLPSAIVLESQPTRLAGQPLTVVDIGGQALAHPITILPFGVETIMGQASLTIANNFGSFTLVPNVVAGGWGQQ